METASGAPIDDTSPLAEALGHLFYYFSVIQPFLPTYFFLFAGSLLPIYAGSHASLHRPVSAAKPPKRKDEGSSAELRIEEETQALAGFERSDVILYPLFAGATLAGLYWLITYLEETAIALITTCLNAYMSIFGLLGIFQLLSDGLEVFISYVFPSAYFDGGRVWMVNNQRRVVLPVKMSKDDKYPGRRLYPLPSFLVKLPIPGALSWWLRDLANRPAFIVEMRAHKLVASIRPTPIRILSAQVAVAVVIYYNFVDRAWWLTNLLGFSFTYSAFQIISPTNFQIGTMLLIGLLFYDIYMVFYTPMMITVATKLDIPAKIMVPNPEMEGKSDFSMLGLGDIVIPGMMMALALRFDLYMFYLKKQRIVVHPDGNAVSSQPDRAVEQETEREKDEAATETLKEEQEEKDSTTPPNQGTGDVKLADPTAAKPIAQGRYKKAVYKKVTSTWGDRYWLGRYANVVVGGNFPKIYFYASVVGYMLGLLVTLVILHIFEHGQPALLYLVPGVLGSLWLTAAVRGEAGVMWKYTEDADEGRAGRIDSAAILQKPVPTIPVPVSDAVEEKKDEDMTAENKEKVEKDVKSDAKANKKEQSDLEDTKAQDETEKRTTETKSMRQENIEESSDSKPNPTKEEEREVKISADTPVTKDRRIFQLVVSLPPPPPRHRKADDSKARREAIEHTTVDWADGEPMEKRRRIS